MKKLDQGLINHVAFVLDRSGSMQHLAKQVVEVADFQIQNLAKISKDFDQETRATVYVFDDFVDCVYYDKDVLRLPSLKNKYDIGGMTALWEATLKAIHDLEQSATLYGDHAFLVYVLSDGMDNRSTAEVSNALRSKLSCLPDNWTVAYLAPNLNAKMTAQAMGFAPGNIEIWEQTKKGVEEVSRKIETATVQYFDSRSKGITRSVDVFKLDKTSVQNAVQVGGLHEVDPRSFMLLNVSPDANHAKGMPEIKQFIEDMTGNHYRAGSTFYQLTKRELVQNHKALAIREKKTGKIFRGDVARQMIGLDNSDKRISPGDSPDYDVFIESTSNNRRLVPYSKVLYFKPVVAAVR